MTVLRASRTEHLSFIAALGPGLMKAKVSSLLCLYNFVVSTDYEPAAFGDRQAWALRPLMLQELTRPVEKLRR